MSEEQRKIALQTEVDATGARQGLGDIKAAAQDMAQGVAQAGQTASKALDGIGAGAGSASDKLDRTTTNIVGSIQRATAAAQAGTKGTADYYDAIGKLKGADGAVLKPYIDKLREVESAQKGANAAVGAGATALDASGMSAKQMAFALRGIPAQFTDIAVSLQSGQRPMTVLLQQGGQLKDMFGGIGPAARAMGGYVLGLVNPLTIAAALVGGLGYAAFLGSKELREFQNATILTGNAIGISNSQFTALRDNLSGIATKGKAAEALTEIAKNGQIAGTNIKGIAEAAILMEKAAGQPIQKTIDLFKDLGDKPAEAALKANEGVNFLTASVYKQIKALEEQGKKADAATLATRALADEMKVRSAEITGNVGAIEGAWNGVLGVLKKVGDSLLNIGRANSTGQKLALVQGQIADATGQNPNKPFRMPWEPSLSDLRQQEGNLQEQLRLEQRLAESAAERAHLLQLTADREKDVDATKTKAQRRDEEIAKTRARDQELINAGKLTEKEMEADIAAIRQKYNENTGASNVASQRAAKLIAQEENARLLRSINTGDFSQPTKLTSAEQKVIQVQEELKESLVGVARANKLRELSAAQAAVQDEKSTQALQKQAEAVKAAKESHEKLVIATGAEADKIREQALEQQRANDMFGKSKTAIEQVRLAEMKKQLAEADAFDSFDPRYVASLKAKTEAQKNYVEQLQRAEFLQESRKLDEQARAAGEEAKSLQLEVGLLGLAGLERSKIIAARKVEVTLAKELADIEKLNLGEGPEAAAQREQLRAKARSNATIESQNAVQKAVLDEWQRTDNEINRSLTDALMRGFEAGKGFAKNLADATKNLFETLILRPTISAVMSPISMAINGAIQPLTAGITSSLSSALGLSSLIPGASALAGGAALTTANTALVAGLTGDVGSAAAASAAAGAAGGAGGITAAIAAIPGWGWAAMGAAAIAGLVLSGRGETRSGGQYSNTDFLQGPSGGEINGDATRTAITATIGQTNELLKALGSSATLANLQSGFESSKNGKGFAYAGGQLSTGQLFGQGTDGFGFNNRRGTMTPEEAAKAYGEELKQVTLQALQAADVPGKLGEYLKSLGDIDKLSGGALDTALAKITKALTEKQQLEARIFDLTATDLEKLTKTRDAERAAIDDSNRSLLDQVYALEDQKKAADAAAAAAQEAARIQTESLNTARSNLTAAYGREKQALEAVRDRMDGFVQKFKSFRDSLVLSDLSPLTPAQRYAEARSQFTKTVADMSSPDATIAAAAMDRFDSVAQTFLATSRDYNASSAAYQADFALVLTQTNKGVSLAQQQYQTTKDSLGALEAMVTGIVDVRDAVLSVADAIKATGALAPNGSADIIGSAYSSLLGRAPDQGGFDYWSARLATGMTADELRNSIMQSPEFLMHPHAGGLDTVPYDNYPALLHKDETILNRTAANQWRYGMNSGNDALIAKVDELTKEVQQLRQQSAEAAKAQIAANNEAHERSAGTIVAGTSNRANRAGWEATLPPRYA